MARFYRVKIGNIYLTSDGSSTGIPCKLSIAGASDLLQTISGSTAVAVDGTPIQVSFASGTKGKILEIKIETLMESVWASCVAAINTALSNQTTVEIVGVGDISNFDVNCMPLLPKPYEAAEFINGRIRNSIFRFITT